MHTTHNEPRTASNGHVVGNLEIGLVDELDERRIAASHFDGAVALETRYGL